jgi:choline dehydrogenase-like flavoprotein
MEKGFHPDFLRVALQEMGIPFCHDFYSDPKNFAGIGWCDIQVHSDGRRSNGAVDLLLPTLEKTKKNGWNNLQIFTNKLVTRVLFDKNRAVSIEALDAPRAYKVDASHQPAGQAKPIIVKARKELIQE